MCSSDLLEIARATTSKPLVAYPNSGETWDARERGWSGDGHALSTHVGEWIAIGARLVGGCCRVGPDQISDVARAVAVVSAGSLGP